MSKYLSQKIMREELFVIEILKHMNRQSPKNKISIEDAIETLNRLNGKVKINSPPVNQLGYYDGKVKINKPPVKHFGLYYRISSGITKQKKRAEKRERKLINNINPERKNDLCMSAEQRKSMEEIFDEDEFEEDAVTRMKDFDKMSEEDMLKCKHIMLAHIKLLDYNMKDDSEATEESDDEVVEITEEIEATQADIEEMKLIYKNIVNHRCYGMYLVRHAYEAYGINNIGFSLDNENVIKTKFEKEDLKRTLEKLNKM
jgi:hypothetical protein